ncbi:branched-chain amino acid ABC transporter permease [Hippea alviniae]|uniref:branched-chain amino acid ABC transporter permease n=1 Tax=Hippea alviniae TaxID=1279027 RepID=UPI0003B586C7|nr:branched-chain amino acid ABC transporter permease [Hippea alviniae]
MSGYIITLLITIGIYIILSLSLNILVGYSGQVSLGHAAFWAIGAYSFAILTTRYSVGFIEASMLSVLITTFVGIILGLPSLRLSEDFLVITTIGINFIVEGIFNTFNYFGGAMGIGNIPFPTINGHMISNQVFALIVYTAVVLTIIISYLFKLSWSGLACSAIKDDELAADVSGVSVVKFKMIAFALSSALAGLSGILYASFMGFISAADFSFPVSVTILAMVMVGGEGTIIGPIFGAALLVLLPELFRPIHDYRMLLYGLLIVLMMRFQPDGFFGRKGIVWSLLKRY